MTAPVEEVSQNLQETFLSVERKNRALLNTLTDLLFVVRKDGIILEFQAPKDSEFAVLSAEIAGRSVRETLPAPIAQQVMYYLEKALRTGEMQTFTSQYHLLERGRDFQARIFISGPGEVLALVRDVTEHKLLEKEILEISNREQTRIGQDLHDGLGQHLTGITFLTRALENRLSAQSLPEAADAAEICKLVVEALTQTRNLARGLFPVELESSGLVSALRELAGTVEQLFSIECHLETDDSVPISNRVMETHLFRLVQEAINNSVKHGKAKRVNISLKTLETPSRYP